MRRALLVLTSCLAAIALYLLAWPVPIEPVAWDAPEDRGLIDPFAPDDRLGPARALFLEGHEGPEDVALGADGNLYVTTAGGVILTIDDQGAVREYANVGGRPLGIEAASDGSLIVANAYLGLQRVAPDGSVTLLLAEFEGQPLVYANEPAIGSDGTIYFSESSTKFGAEAFGGTYEASLLDVMEHGGHGRVFALRPDSGEASVILDGLQFANGVAVGPDDAYLLIAETGSYRILRHWLRGDQRGTTEVLIDNLPAFPDNINDGLNGKYWVGLIAPRVAVLDTLSARPFLRKVVQRLPAALRPRAKPYAHVIAIDGNGEILMNLQDPAARITSLTGVRETPAAIYLTSLFGGELPVLYKSDL